MGIIPLQFLNGQTTDSNGLTGKEQFSIELPAEITPGCEACVTTDSGKKDWFEMFTLTEILNLSYGFCNVVFSRRF